MRLIRPTLTRPEIPDEKSHGGGRALDLPCPPTPLAPIRQHVQVGVSGIGVRDHDLRRNPLATFQLDARRTTIVDQNAADRRIATHLPTLPFDQIHESMHEAPGAAHCKVHAVLTLQVRNKRVNGGRARRIAADKERMEAQNLTQLLTLHVARDQAIHRPVGLQSKQIGHYADHRRNGVEWLVNQLPEADPVDLRRICKEALVARDIVRSNALHFLTHRSRVPGVLECLSIIEADSIERIAGNDLDVIRKRAAAEAPEFLEQKRSCHDCGPGIEREPVLLEDIGPATRRIEAF